MQERYTVISKEIKKRHPDIQVIEDIIKQLLEKRKGAAANDLYY